MTFLRLAALPALLLPACMTEGERAETGQCPAGEVCSSRTPNGLAFDGADFSDLLFANGLQATALGGRQGVTIYDGASGQAMRLPFAATTQGALEVVAQATGSLDVIGRRAGTDLLRIVDPATGELYDRVSMSVRPVDRVELRNEVFGEIGLEDRPRALWAGGRASLVVALSARDGTRLVDEAMVVTASTGTRNTRWDSISFDVPADGEVTLDAAFGGGEAVSFALPVAAAADAVVALPLDQPTIAVGGMAEVCFRADAGERAILGAPWRFTVTGPATMPGSSLGRNCALVKSTAVGTITITAEVGAVRASVNLPVTASAARVARPLPEASGPTPGERAGW